MFMSSLQTRLCGPNVQLLHYQFPRNASFMIDLLLHFAKLEHELKNPQLRFLVSLIDAPLTIPYLKNTIYPHSPAHFTPQPCLFPPEVLRLMVKWEHPRRQPSTVEEKYAQLKAEQ